MVKVKKSVKKVQKKDIVYEKKDLNLSNLFSSSWMIFKKRIWLIIVLSLLLSVLPQVIGNEILGLKYGFNDPFEGVTDWEILFYLFISYFSYLVPFILILGILGVLLTSSIILILPKKEEKISFSNALSEGSNIFLKMLGFSIVTMIFLLFLFLLLIIPGVIFLVYWSIAIYVLVFEKKKIIESLRISKERVKGNWWTVFLYMIVIILIYFGISIGVGIVTLPISLILLSLKASIQNNLILIVILDSIVNLISGFLNSLMSAFSLIFYYCLYLELSKGKINKL
jgi:hypothetical protein